MKKILVLFLTLILTFSVAFSTVGCRNTGEKIDKSKTQLYVTTFEGGYGTGWIEAVENRFQDAYADVSFEPGKKGVQIIVKPERELTHDSLIVNLKGSKQEVFFTESVNYYDLKQRGLLYDISEAVTKPLNYDFVSGKTVEGEETVSIADKMKDLHRDYFNAGSSDSPAYFGLPFYEATYGIIYNVDLFEENKLYFAPNGNFIPKSDSTRSNGPDGKTGVIDGVDYTADDGLPATYDEFFKLCDKMVEKGITPITWNGVDTAYLNALIESLQADYEGEEQMRLNYTQSGTATHLVKKINADGTVEFENPTQITKENGYLTWTKQAGKYYGLSFVERIIANTSYYNRSKVVTSTYDQISAQKAFVTSTLNDEKDIAMLVDGSWWHNEATSVFTAASQNFGANVGSAKARKFGLMPLPKATADKVGESYSPMEVNSSICFVNGNLDKKKDKLVKEFIQFCHTNASLAEFTSETYTTKPFDYTMTDDQIKEMPYWGQQLYKMHGEVNYIPSYSKSELYVKYASDFTEIYRGKMFQGKYNGTYFERAHTAMIENGITAEQYFMGLANVLNSDEWARRYLG
ncbi:MAG: extracellular solute-binding protein [Clostridia bacterium]|nr:extracellular solute-binding protein [Clostridia bacterium]